MDDSSKMTVILYLRWKAVLCELMNVIQCHRSFKHSAWFHFRTTLYSFVCLFVVGEEDELSIKEAAELVVEGMQFKGEVEVSFVNRIFKGLLYVRGGGKDACVQKWFRVIWESFLYTLAGHCHNWLKKFTY